MPHDHDHDHDELGEEEDEIVEFEDADGNTVAFTFLAVVEVDGEEFALLTPADAPDDAEQTEIYIFAYGHDEDGGETFSEVDDDETLAKVQAEAEKLFLEGEDEDEEEA